MEKVMLGYIYLDPALSEGEIADASEDVYNFIFLFSKIKYASVIRKIGCKQATEFGNCIFQRGRCLKKIIGLIT